MSFIPEKNGSFGRYEGVGALDIADGSSKGGTSLFSQDSFLDHAQEDKHKREHHYNPKNNSGGRKNGPISKEQLQEEYATSSRTGRCGTPDSIPSSDGGVTLPTGMLESETTYYSAYPVGEQHEHGVTKSGTVDSASYQPHDGNTTHASTVETPVESQVGDMSGRVDMEALSHALKQGNLAYIAAVRAVLNDKNRTLTREEYDEVMSTLDRLISEN
ncbi:hypothetical protein RUND412_004954 [Rhizina undulata]